MLCCLIFSRLYVETAQNILPVLHAVLSYLHQSRRDHLIGIYLIYEGLNENFCSRVCGRIISTYSYDDLWISSSVGNNPVPTRPAELYIPSAALDGLPPYAIFNYEFLSRPHIHIRRHTTECGRQIASKLQRISSRPNCDVYICMAMSST